jgi:hypothetical protein
MTHVLILAAALASAAPTHAPSDLEKGFAGALRGCEEWVLNPASWANGMRPFIATVGLGNKMGLVSQVDDAILPPKDQRQGNHYWRINSTPGAGYILIVSDALPMCHITGGGNIDLQPVVETVLASPEFGTRWERVADVAKGDMASTRYRNREDPRLSIVISRAKQVSQRLDRVQVLATATYNTEK